MPTPNTNNQNLLAGNQQFRSMSAQPTFSQRQTGRNMFMLPPQPPTNPPLSGGPGNNPPNMAMTPTNPPPRSPFEQQQQHHQQHHQQHQHQPQPHIGAIKDLLQELTERRAEETRQQIADMAAAQQQLAAELVKVREDFQLEFGKFATWQEGLRAGLVGMAHKQGAVRREFNKAKEGEAPTLVDSLNVLLSSQAEAWQESANAAWASQNANKAIGDVARSLAEARQETARLAESHEEVRRVLGEVVDAQTVVVGELAPAKQGEKATMRDDVNRVMLSQGTARKENVWIRATLEEIQTTMNKYEEETRLVKADMEGVERELGALYSLV